MYYERVYTTLVEFCTLTCGMRIFQRIFCVVIERITSATGSVAGRHRRLPPKVNRHWQLLFTPHYYQKHLKRTDTYPKTHIPHNIILSFTAIESYISTTLEYLLSSV